MTPEQQRIAIHNALKRLPANMTWCEGGWCYHDQVGNVFGPIPDYLNALNVMHEAEKVLTREQQDEYANHLYPMLPCDENHGPGGDGEEDIMTASMFQVMHATAAQRAEAFLKTIEKWSE